MTRALVLAGILALIAATTGTSSNAANYSIGEEVAAACEGRPGEIDPAAAVERDLTGDGRTDFILSHEGITCSGGGSARSNAPGMQGCSVLIYVRRGQLLEQESEMLGMGVRIGGGSVPIIHIYRHGGRTATLRLDGQAFQ